MNSKHQPAADAGSRELYIHIPFCVKKCAYCDFLSFPDGEKERVFEMFYSGSGNGPENRRSVGMGLSLCRAIVQAHGGEILLRDNIPSGAAFTFTLPLSEVDVHE